MAESKKSLPAFIGFFTSLKLTIACLTYGFALVFWGTLQQVHLGIDQAVEVYFRSWFVWVTPFGSSLEIPIMFGGFSVGAMLLLNLVAAHVYRFRISWRMTGIWLTHLGLIILLVGEVMSAKLQQDAVMRIEEGQTVSYTESQRHIELAIIDQTDPKTDQVVAVADWGLDAGTVVQRPELPFRVEIRAFFRNGFVQRRVPGLTSIGAPEATQGLGTGFVVREAPRTTKQNERDLGVVLLEVVGREGSLGTWMVVDAPVFQGAQTFTYEGRTFSLELRSRREYLPFSITLIDFTHDVYPGTDRPRDFASQIRLVDPRRNEDREVRIYMNHPLRYDGLTFYQHSFESGDTTSILQVVRNPAALLPYISCVMVCFGLLIHFGIHLTRFLSNRSEKMQQPGAKAASMGPIPWIVAGFALVSVLIMAFRPQKAAERHWREFGQIPVQVGGRIKPLDTVARNALILIHDKQTLRVPDESAGGGRKKSLTAIEWLAEVVFDPQKAAQRDVFRIHDPQVLGLFGWEQGSRKDFSYAELRPFGGEVVRQAQLANDVEPKQRSAFQSHILDLYRQLTLFQKLRNSLQPDDAEHFADEVARFEQAMPGLRAIAARRAAGEQLSTEETQMLAMVEGRYEELGDMAHMLTVPPNQAAAERDRTTFSSMGGAIIDTLRSSATAVPVPVRAFNAIGAAYRSGDIEAFNRALADYDQWLAGRYDPEMKKTERETFFNRLAPFYVAMSIYVLIFILGCVSWMTGPGRVRDSAFLLMIVAFAVHTVGIGFRMWLEGRPPVTNLYSSAVFVGYISVGIAIILEWIFRNAIGSVVSGVIGFCTLLIAHHLSVAGDTMEMMQAVLDSNFWLATHVVVITVGYGATFLAGFLALGYIVLGLWTRKLTAELGRNIYRMVYGVVCFATLTSFVGTVLGGIWADQSWGRFWGWDPKENGAVLIVLWNAVVLHSRWGGYVRERGFMIMAVFGNIVTAWSWFGTNMLGIGLHSYGFMDKAFIALIAFAATQVAMMFLGGLPTAAWRSFAGLTPPKVPPAK